MKILSTNVYPKTQYKPQNAHINFRARFEDSYYDERYEAKPDWNGNSPDTFIIKRLNALGKKPQDIVVYDIGAGVGRNSIPIAQMGYRVYANEISKAGRIFTSNKATAAGISDNLKALGQNVLDELHFGEKADFAFMSHVTQHFNAQELETALKNVSNSMHTGGEIIFDALVRADKNYKEYDKATYYWGMCTTTEMEKHGVASFWKDDIIKAAKGAGLSIVCQTPFKEKAAAKYTQQAFWGKSGLVSLILGIHKKPVELTWFVLKKV